MEVQLPFGSHLEVQLPFGSHLEVKQTFRKLNGSQTETFILLPPIYQIMRWTRQEKPEGMLLCTVLACLLVSPAPCSCTSLGDKATLICQRPCFLPQADEVAASNWPFTISARSPCSYARFPSLQPSCARWHRSSSLLVQQIWPLLYCCTSLEKKTICSASLFPAAGR